MNERVKKFKQRSELLRILFMASHKVKCWLLFGDFFLFLCVTVKNNYFKQ